MGNKNTTLGDDEIIGKLSNFDHSYKSFIRISIGNYFSIFVSFNEKNQEVQLICHPNYIEILVDSLVNTDRKKCILNYGEITEVGWDHSLCEVKFSISPPKSINPQFIILHVPTSVELEYELKQRFLTLFQESQIPQIPLFMYVGMFAGATKPKPFQRKRPNISKVRAGKLPILPLMREIAIRRHNGTYVPCPVGVSRRINLALEHIYEGCNTFPILFIQGDYGSLHNKEMLHPQLVIQERKMTIYLQGINNSGEEIQFDCISGWLTEDNDTKQPRYNFGIRIYLTSNATYGIGELFLGFTYVRDVKHTLEFFWNKFQLERGLPVMLGSTHGRPIETIHTLLGDCPAPDPPQGQIEIVNSDGLVVRPGTLVKTGSRSSLTRSSNRRDSFRRANSLNTLSFKNDSLPLPHETKVRNHWRSIVKHQGWLLKKGGLGLKQWIKRYFVLYSTSQGHFLVYYSDILECPMYTTERLQRNVIDLAKATFIRPGSNREDSNDIPPFSFDIQTTEREWTLCAESQDNVYKWLQMLTRAIDEDVAIIPDETLEFKVKAKKDPTGQCISNDYSTTLLLSAYAVSLNVPDVIDDGVKRLVCTWIYTDFYKWSIVAQNGKLALQLSIFTDEFFTHKAEFLFRTKEALELAAAIEYFIEKFMVTMHVQLELDDTSNVDTSTSASGERKLPHASPDQWQSELLIQLPEDDDLLGFGSDDLGLNTTDDSNNLTGNESISPSLLVDGVDSFGYTAPPPPISLRPSYVPLTTLQIEQHQKWFLSLLSSGNGPLYDDNVLQISCRLEIRGSQGRLSLFYRNNSTVDTLSSLNVTLTDSAQLLRTQISPMQSHLIPNEYFQQEILMECLRPVVPGPSIIIGYNHSQGARMNIISLPITCLSFNDPLKLNHDEFISRWDMLIHPGQEIIETIILKNLVTIETIRYFLQNVFKFYLIEENTKVSGDENIQSLLGSSSLRTGSINSSTGEKITLGCLIKINYNQTTNNLQINCRTVLPIATSSIIYTVKEYLN